MAESSVPVQKVENIRKLWENIPSDNWTAEKIRNAYIAATVEQFRDFTREIEKIVAIPCSWDLDAVTTAFNQLPEIAQVQLLTAIDWIGGTVQSLISQLGQRYETSQVAAVIGQARRGIQEASGVQFPVLLQFQTGVELNLQLRRLAEKISLPDHSQIQSKLEDLVKKSEEARSAAEKLMSAATESARTATAEESLEEIAPVIRFHEKAEALWLRILVWCAAFLLALLVMLNWISFVAFSEGMGVTQTIVIGVTKLFLVSFVLGLCIFAAKIYQGHVHNSIVNRQRKLSYQCLLKLSVALQAAAPETRQEVLSHATAAIFSQTNTGFLNPKNTDFTAIAQMLDPIVELTKRSK